MLGATCRWQAAHAAATMYSSQAPDCFACGNAVYQKPATALLNRCQSRGCAAFKALPDMRPTTNALCICPNFKIDVKRYLEAKQMLLQLGHGQSPGRASFGLGGPPLPPPPYPPLLSPPYPPPPPPKPPPASAGLGVLHRGHADLLAFTKYADAAKTATTKGTRLLACRSGWQHVSRYRR